MPPTSEIGENDAVAAEYDRTDALRGASFTDADLRDARFRSCDMRGVRIVDSWLVDVNVSGAVGKFVINDVDVSSFVEDELRKRHPERTQLQSIKTADDYRAMWDTIERLWSDAAARIERLPEAARYEQVDGEWSFVETMRHLVFATDAWASRTVLDEPMPYHRLGLTHTSYPPDDAVALGIDNAAKPSFAEVMEVRADRVALVRRILDGLTDAELDRMCTRTPAPGYPDEPHSVGTCLRVVMDEECDHYRYTARDISVLEAR